MSSLVRNFEFENTVLKKLLRKAVDEVNEKDEEITSLKFNVEHLTWIITELTQCNKDLKDCCKITHGYPQHENISVCGRCSCCKLTELSDDSASASSVDLSDLNPIKVESDEEEVKKPVRKPSLIKDLKPSDFATRYIKCPQHCECRLMSADECEYEYKHYYSRNGYAMVSKDQLPAEAPESCLIHAQCKLTKEFEYIHGTKGNGPQRECVYYVEPVKKPVRKQVKPVRKEVEVKKPVRKQLGPVRKQVEVKKPVRKQLKVNKVPNCICTYADDECCWCGSDESDCECYWCDKVRNGPVEKVPTPKKKF